MSKHKPVDPIYNNRLKPIIDLIGDTLLGIVAGVGSLIFDTVFDCVEELMKGPVNAKVAIENSRDICR